jgi:hypothetical protein
MIGRPYFGARPNQDILPYLNDSIGLDHGAFADSGSVTDEQAIYVPDPDIHMYYDAFSSFAEVLAIGFPSYLPPIKPRNILKQGLQQLVST